MVNKKHLNKLLSIIDDNFCLNRIIRLNGEYDLGQRETLEKVIEYAEKKEYICLDLSSNILTVPLTKLWNSLDEHKRFMEDYLNYHFDSLIEFLFYKIRLLCEKKSNLFFYCYDISKCDEMTLKVIEKIFDYLLPDYNIVFFICNYTKSNIKKIYNDFFETYTKYIFDINFTKWPKKELQNIINNRFDDKLYISDDDLDVILLSAFGNPNRLNNIINYLISQKLIYTVNGIFYCKNLGEDVLFFDSQQYIFEQYECLNKKLQRIIRSASILGTKFDYRLLEKPLNYNNVTLYLNEIERINQLIRKRNHPFYEFYNQEACSFIKDLISPEEYNNWCVVLARYFYDEGNSEFIKQNAINCCNYYLASGYYYAEANEYELVIYIYQVVISVFISISLYQQALNIISNIEKMDIQIDGRIKKELTLKKAYCYFSLFKFAEAAKEYEFYINNALMNTKENIKLNCQYILSLYNSGEIEQAHKIANEIYSKNFKNGVNNSNAPIIVNVLSILSSIEETLCLPDCESHFNLALTYAKNYKVTNSYYELLRKSFIVHSKKNSIRLMESAKEYYKNINSKKDYAMTIHNIATISMPTGDLKTIYNYCIEAISTFEEIGSDGVHYAYNCLGLYWNLTGHYKKAKKCFKAAYKERYELFSKIVILINEAVSNIKLKYYKKALIIIRRINEISKEEEAKNFNILIPYINIVNFLYYQEIHDINQANLYYKKYFECESEKDSYRYVFSVKNYYDFCTVNKLAFPNEFNTYLKSKNSKAETLLKNNIILVHLAFAE